MSKFKLYRKKEAQKMRPYMPGEDLTNISVAACDTPELGGMIAVGDDDTDKWYVAKEFFEKNYELINK